MKEKQQQVGVWMDHHQAIFISSPEQNGEFAIQQKVTAEDHHRDSSEHKSHNAERADQRKYFKAIGQHLTGYDEIFVFGPGKSQEEMRNFLHEDQHFKGKSIALAASDHLTDHQMVARVRDFFKE